MDRKIRTALAAAGILSGLAMGSAFAQSSEDHQKMSDSKMSGDQMSGKKMSHQEMMDKMGKMSVEDKAAMFDKMPSQDKADMFDKMPMAKKMSMMQGGSMMHEGQKMDSMGKDKMSKQ